MSPTVGAEGPGFKSQPRRCRVTVLGKLFTPIVPQVKSTGSLPPGLWLTSPAGWLPRTGISSGTLRSVIEYGLPLQFLTLKVNLTPNVIRERTGVRGQMFGGGQKSSHSHCTATLWSSAGWTIDLRLFGTPIDGCQLIFGRVITGLWSYISDNKMAVSTPWNYWHIGISTNAYVLQSIGTVYGRLRYHSISGDLTKSICCSIGLYTPYRRSNFFVQPAFFAGLSLLQIVRGFEKVNFLRSYRMF